MSPYSRYALTTQHKRPQCVLTHIMKVIQTLHIYGSVAITSQPCPCCKERSFVIDGVMSCCGVSPEAPQHQNFKIEVDKTLGKRKQPGRLEKRRLLEDQDNRCFYCEAEFGTFRVLNCKLRPVLIEWDHVVPFSYDGNNSEFVAACRECNRAKSGLHFASLYELRQHLQLKIHEKRTSS
jgi:hypothetical protein